MDRQATKDVAVVCWANSDILRLRLCDTLPMP